MTPEQMRTGLVEALEDARNSAARHLTVPVVLTLEGLGYRIVPAWMIEIVDKVMQKAAEPCMSQEKKP